MALFQDLIDKTKDYLATRKHAYLRTFDSENVLATRVLQDLAKFCRAHETTFHPDPRLHAALEGRREVWLRITNHLNLSQEELWKLYGRSDLE